MILVSKSTELITSDSCPQPSAKCNNIKRHIIHRKMISKSKWTINFVTPTKIQSDIPPVCVDEPTGNVRTPTSIARRFPLLLAHTNNDRALPVAEGLDRLSAGYISTPQHVPSVRAAVMRSAPLINTSGTRPIAIQATK